MKRSAWERLESGRLWFDTKDVDWPEGPPSQCTSLFLETNNRKTAASAFFDPTSRVPLRVYARGRVAFDASFLAAQLSSAVAYRKRILPSEDTGYRLVHAEADSLPGLVVDRLGSHFSIQTSLANWRPWLGDIYATLAESMPVESSALETKEGRERIHGDPPAEVAYRMNGLKFLAPTQSGPKTGAFLDQRDNYLAAAGWAQRLGAQEYALDLFTANGGFARHLVPYVERVEAVDSSAAAIELLKKSLEATEKEKVRAVAGDVFEYLQARAKSRHRYSVIVVDPPAYAKSRSQRDNAVRKYADLNRRAIGLAGSGALYVTCSCSHHIHATDLEDVVRSVAWEKGKTLQLLERRGQSPDHPVLASHPESEYLKCLLYRVLY
ncbi:MAG: class I SAM-dependent rRNA methyltransferase [Bryobacter sp.]|nr:class I SAM-dependent rRNA methyltransferase [Bryobacter sp.]